MELMYWKLCKRLTSELTSRWLRWLFYDCIFIKWELFFVVEVNIVEVEYEQKYLFLDILVSRTESIFEYSIYRKRTNKNALPHFFCFHDTKVYQFYRDHACELYEFVVQSI